jgi:hypothetical protein
MGHAGGASDPTIIPDANAASGPPVGSCGRSRDRHHWQRRETGPNNTLHIFPSHAKYEYVHPLCEAQNHSQGRDVLAEETDSAILFGETPEVVKVQKRGHEANEPTQAVTLANDQDEGRNTDDQWEDNTANPLHQTIPFRWPVQAIADRAWSTKPVT